MSPQAQKCIEAFELAKPPHGWEQIIAAAIVELDMWTKDHPASGPRTGPRGGEAMNTLKR